MKTEEDQVLIFGMKNLLLEKALSDLEKKGIDLGHSSTLKENPVVDTELFEHDILIRAKKMSSFYTLYFSLENSVKRLIRSAMSEKYGFDWWNTKVPPGVKDSVKKIQDDEKQSSMSVRSEDPLDYTTFGELIPIFEQNWIDFSDQFRSFKSLQQTLSPLNKIRNVIAHSCDLNDDEITRFTLLIKDWFRIQN